MIDFSQPADIVAPQLLGAVIWHGPVGIQLTEVEAYLGEADAASHAYKGLTPRCATMFGPPGRLYVYASYGIHRAGNLVCSADGVAGGVLLRAGRVVAGHDVVRQRRSPKPTEDGLARGPGNLGACLGLDLHLNGSVVEQLAPGSDSSHIAENAGNADFAENGDNTDQATDGFRLIAGEPVEEYRVGPRIGITKNADAPLRFWIAGDKTVTSPRR